MATEEFHVYIRASVRTGVCVTDAAVGSRVRFDVVDELVDTAVRADTPDEVALSVTGTEHLHHAVRGGLSVVPAFETLANVGDSVVVAPANGHSLSVTYSSVARYPLKRVSKGPLGFEHHVGAEGFALGSPVRTGSEPPGSGQALDALALPSATAGSRACRRRAVLSSFERRDPTESSVLVRVSSGVSGVSRVVVGRLWLTGE